MLSTTELQRYNRHLLLPEIGTEGQEKLKAARVAVIGAGGLGCPVLQYLTAAGTGIIGIIDDDRVDISNLQRQVLYTVEDVGRKKAACAAERLAALNPHIRFQMHTERLTPDNALKILAEYDIIVDGSDNFATRYLASDLCVLLEKPLVSGSVFRFEGQVAVFNYRGSGTYRCLFPEPPSPEDSPSCSEIGVLGVLPGVIGCLQANEVIKIITGTGNVLANTLLMFDSLTMQFTTLRFRRTAQAEITKLSTLPHYCAPSTIPEIGVETLHQVLHHNSPVQLLDVRELSERNICSLGGQHIPLNVLPEHLQMLHPGHYTVVYCHRGTRSAQAVALLRQNGFTDVYSLTGGIDRWARDIDPSMMRY